MDKRAVAAVMAVPAKAEVEKAVMAVLVQPVNREVKVPTARTVWPTTSLS